VKKWKKKEQKDKEFFGGTLQRGSGNQWAFPGDIKTADLLIESKQTDKNSFTITRQLWDKIYEEALLLYRYPLMSIKIKDIDLVVMSREDFNRLTCGALLPPADHIPHKE
jgi:hypothetical protein